MTQNAPTPRLAHCASVVHWPQVLILGSLPQRVWPEADWRNVNFTPQRLAETLERVDRIRPLLPDGMDLPELALRFILEHPAVSTVIPGMRRVRHVERNLRASDGQPLPPRLRDALRAHRWDRVPEYV